MSKIRTASTSKQGQPFRLKRSAVHGLGAFATRPIKKGQKIIEYVGDVISHAEADRRFEKKKTADHHTFLFTIDRKWVIDAAHGGNDSRFINHSCAPNCEVILHDKSPVVEALRAIAPGEELAYDYNLTRDPDDTENEAEKIFKCRCGAATCRGTMLAPLKKKRAAAPAAAKKKTAKTKTAKKTPAPAKTKTKTPAKKRAR